MIQNVNITQSIVSIFIEFDLLLVITVYLENAIEVNNVSAIWDEKSSRKTLNQIDLKIKPGQLCAIIGPVGGGKVCHNPHFRNPTFKRVIILMIDN